MDWMNAFVMTAYKMSPQLLGALRNRDIFTLNHAAAPLAHPALDQPWLTSSDIGFQGMEGNHWQNFFVRLSKVRVNLRMENDHLLWGANPTQGPYTMKLTVKFGYLSQHTIRQSSIVVEKLWNIHAPSRVR